MLEPYLYPFVLLFLLLPIVIFLYQKQYPAFAHFNGFMLNFMKIFFFILAIALLGFGLMSFTFQGEYLREPSAMQSVFKIASFVFFLLPLASALWFAFLRNKFPLRFGAWLPLMVTVGAGVLGYICMIMAETL